jgi:hypothetical protein
MRELTRHRNGTWTAWYVWISLKPPGELRACTARALTNRVTPLRRFLDPPVTSSAQCHTKWQEKMFHIFYSMRFYTKFWIEWLQAFPEINLSVITSGMHFWFMSVASKYINSAIFRKDLLAVIKLVSLSSSLLRHENILSSLSIYS